MIKETIIPIYMAKLRVIDDLEHIPEDVKYNPHSQAGVYFDDDDILTLAYNKTDFLTPDLVHECVHIANTLLRVRGVQTTQENDEAHAYLCGYLFAKLMEVVGDDVRRNDKRAIAVLAKQANKK